MIQSSPQRRTFLRAAGIGLGLPLFESCLRTVHASVEAAGTDSPQRMIFVCRGLGLHAPDFFPQQFGRDYELSPYLLELAEFRDQFTVISGLSHPHAGAGHAAEVAWLTGAPHAGSPAFRNSVSVDQVAAEFVGNATRFPFLALTTHNSGLSTTRNGVQIPPEKNPAELFRRLFIQGTPREMLAQEERLRRGRSILDSVRSELASLQDDLATPDRARLDQYTSAVREVEKRLHNSEAWMQRPKPAVVAEPPAAMPSSEDIVGRSTIMYDLMHLALQTDSTRLITMLMDQAGGNGVPPIEGVSQGHHGLSHHGMDPTKIEQLRRVEIAELKALAAFLEKLKSTTESQGGTLLDNTMLLYGSNMGNASSHDTRNLPILLAGGRFKHGQHLSVGKESNVPLSNLYASMLQRFGVETDQFSSGTGTLTGLDFA